MLGVQHLSFSASFRAMPGTSARKHSFKYSDDFMDSFTKVPVLDGGERTTDDGPRTTDH